MYEYRKFDPSDIWMTIQVEPLGFGSELDTIVCSRRCLYPQGDTGEVYKNIGSTYFKAAD